METHHSLEDLLTTQSFVLWIKGECSPQEKKYWDKWESKDFVHAELAREAGEIVKAVRSEHAIPDSQIELQKLNRELNRRKNQPLKPLSYPKQPVWWQHTGAVAAGFILVIVLLGGLLAYQYNVTEKGSPEELATPKKVFNKSYTTSYGEKVTFRLSDGSSIILNANSILRFSSALKKGLNTQVWLQGEAYFDIAHLEGEDQRAFTVHTSSGDIRVLGTRFAVNTFERGTQTALEQGKISIRIKDNDNKSTSDTEYVLKPGEMARFTNGDNKVAIKEADMRLYTSWTEDKFTFAQTPMEDVARRIERTFGVDVAVSPKYKEELVTGTIRSDNLGVLTQALEKALRARVHQQGKTLQIGKPDERSNSKEIE